MCKPEHASDVFYLREAGDKALEYKNELEVIYDEWLSLQEDEQLNSLNNMSEGCRAQPFFMPVYNSMDDYCLTYYIRLIAQLM